MNCPTTGVPAQFCTCVKCQKPAAPVKERPILFSASMVRAILEGRKTQTRRVVKPQPEQPASNCHPAHAAKHAAPYLDAYCSQRKTAENPRGMSDQWCWWQVDDRQCLPTFRCPYGQPGDRLWVREAWNLADPDDLKPERRGNRAPFTGCQGPRSIPWVAVYRADGELPSHPEHGRAIWQPSIHMPRWASRITLEVTGVRVERLNDISPEDAAAEGWPGPDAQNSIHTVHAIAWYSGLWEGINGPGRWGANPWVWVVEFKRVEARA